MRKKIKVSVALDRELVVRLDGIAKVTNASRSKVIDQLLREGIEGSEQMAKLMADPETRRVVIESFSKPGFLQSVANAMGQKLPAGAERILSETMEETGQAVADAKVGELKKGKGKKS